MKAEENGIVLDFLAHGKSSGYKAEPLAQVLGLDNFTLLEVIPKEGFALKIGETVYIGKEGREKIDYIKRRVPFKELTSTAVSELENMVEKIVLQKEQQFVDFFNNSKSITLKRHQLELLPGLGKKHMLAIINEREKAPFASFEDIKKRVHLLPDVVKTIVKRVIEELSEESDKHYLFARPPVEPKSQFDRRDFRR